MSPVLVTKLGAMLLDLVSERAEIRCVLADVSRE